MIPKFFENFRRNFVDTNLFDTNQNDEVTYFSYKSTSDDLVFVVPPLVARRD